jgi:hypothetical protein
MHTKGSSIFSQASVKKRRYATRLHGTIFRRQYFEDYFCVRWLKLALSKGPNKIGVFPHLKTETDPVSETSWVLLLCFLITRTMDRVWTLNVSESYTSSSESYSNYYCVFGQETKKIRILTSLGPFGRANRKVWYLMSETEQSHVLWFRKLGRYPKCESKESYTPSDFVLRLSTYPSCIRNPHVYSLRFLYVL